MKKTEQLLYLMNIWLSACKCEITYNDCHSCPSRRECEQADKQIRKLIEGK